MAAAAADKIANRIATHVEKRAIEMTEAEFCSWFPGFMEQVRAAIKNGTTECWMRANGFPVPDRF